MEAEEIEFVEKRIEKFIKNNPSIKIGYPQGLNLLNESLKTIIELNEEYKKAELKYCKTNVELNKLYDENISIFRNILLTKYTKKELEEELEILAKLGGRKVDNLSNDQYFRYLKFIINNTEFLWLEDSEGNLRNP